MSNEELLARLDERQKHIAEQLTNIYTQAVLTNGRLRQAESDIKDLKADMAVVAKVDTKLESVETRLEGVEHFRERIIGNWKAVVIIALIFGFVVGAFLEYVRP